MCHSCVAHIKALTCVACEALTTRPLAFFSNSFIHVWCPQICTHDHSVPKQGDTTAAYLLVALHHLIKMH